LTLWLNEKEIGASEAALNTIKLDVTKGLHNGANILAVRAASGLPAAGLVAVLDIEESYGKRQIILTDDRWISAPDAPAGWEQLKADTHGWAKALSVGRLGDAPWGPLFTFESVSATPVSEITAPAGFRVELLRSAQPGEGSWVCMAIDPQGRLYISPQQMEKAAGAGGILRVTIGHGDAIEKIEPVKVAVGAAMGMLWAFDSLYVSGDGPEGHGIYRLRHAEGADELTTAELFKKIQGGAGEHGAHAIVLGPDQHLYIVHGNSTPLVDGIASDSPYQHYEEDDVIPRIKDPVATFFDKVKIPYGQVLRTDADGKKWELFAGGLRNPYDIAFNPDGELVTYDSDMEWDVGLPWYRPTRILHITSGAEFGFREGTAKWPEYYADSLPAVIPIGLGSPTGMKFGTKSNFPEEYRTALFAHDWTYGRILAVHFTPHGAGYEANFEDFLKGKGLPVTDMEFGPDGALYFITGGRGTQAGLYRVSYIGSSDRALPTTAAGAPKPTSEEAARGAEARAARHHLESFHGHADAQAIDAAWGYLNSDDRYLRFAARVAVESQPVEQWRTRALAEPRPRAALQALLALARCGSKADQEPLLKAMEKWPLDSLDEPLKLDFLRVMEVAIARQGRPAEEQVSAAIGKLEAQWPARSFPLNRELCELLVSLGAPGVVEKSLQMIETSAAPEEQIWFVYCLGVYDGPWTAAQRERYFQWFHQAGEYHGGNSFSKFLDRIREIALAKAPVEERTKLASLSEPEAPVISAPIAPARQFVRSWTVAELTPELDQIGQHRNFARGKEIFSSVLCMQCHHFGNEGGNVGPDLTAVGGRFSRHDILEAIIEPSKAISEQYAAFIVTTTKGDALMGLVAEQDADQLVLITDPLRGTRQTILKKEIASKQISPVSLMPPGLLNILTKEEIFDLLAYLESAGNPSAPEFSGK
jgi:putative heme-binding domain-containing protein